MMLVLLLFMILPCAWTYCWWFLSRSTREGADVMTEVATKLSLDHKVVSLSHQVRMPVSKRLNNAVSP